MLKRLNSHAYRHLDCIVALRFCASSAEQRIASSWAAALLCPGVSRYRFTSGSDRKVLQPQS